MVTQGHWNRQGLSATCDFLLVFEIIIIIIIIIIIVIDDCWTKAECPYVRIFCNWFYYIHVLPTPRIDVQFQCRWPGDHTQNHNFPIFIQSVLELIYSISHYF